MNRHLNLFKAFSQNLSHENIEDNLSRALVLCLQNNSLLLHEFFKIIFTETNQKSLYNAIFTDITELDNLKMDIQVTMNNINTEEFSKIFAIAISGISLNMSDFFTNKLNTNKTHITDIFISINDIAFVIEVKRNNDDCKNQLYQQVATITDSVTEENVFPFDFNWKKIMVMVTQINGFEKVNNQKDKFLNDFIDLIKSHNPNWLPVAPFASIANTIQNRNKFKQRIDAALNKISGDQSILNYSDRIGIQINTGWASEIVINIRENKNNLVDLRFGIWPGNTKGQGWQMLGQLNKNRNWSPPKQLQINNAKFNVEWDYEIKFCHFNGFITNIILSDKDIKAGKKLISDEVHRKYTGKYLRANWNNLENFLDDYIEPHFDWRKYMNWDKNFIHTNRTYLTMSIGYEIETIIPAQYIQQIDKNIDDLDPLSNLIGEVQKNYEMLFKI
jgi:hypothetical protein